MKVRAHPLMVAVALGLIAPQALAEEEEPKDERVRCPGCTCEGADPVSCPTSDVAVDVTLADDAGANLDVAIDALWSDLRSL